MFASAARLLYEEKGEEAEAAWAQYLEQVQWTSRARRTVCTASFIAVVSAFSCGTNQFGSKYPSSRQARRGTQQGRILPGELATNLDAGSTSILSCAQHGRSLRLANALVFGDCAADRARFSRGEWDQERPLEHCHSQCVSCFPSPSSLPFPRRFVSCASVAAFLLLMTI